MPLSPSFSRGKTGAEGGVGVAEKHMGGGRATGGGSHPERMRDKDGSRDILSTSISSGGGEPR